MSTKAVFLDVDGTYLDPTGQVPASAATAVQTARANGHRVLLCTGRSVAEIWDHITAAGFDGIIASGGGYVTYQGDVLQHLTLPRAILRRALAFLDERGIDYILEANAGLFGSPGCRRHLARIKHPLAPAEELEQRLATSEVFIKPVIDSEPPVRDDINKICLLGSDTPAARIRAEFAGDLDVIEGTIPMYGPNMCELALPGIHKAAAIQLLLDHAGLHRRDSVAFGEGANDFEMIGFVQTGVVMADGHPDLLAIADLVTHPAAEHGLADGFARIGLI